MFVFKAAVVGAGTMGGQIAQVIAATGLPVVLKDVSQDAVQAGVTEARRVTKSRAAKLVGKGRLEQGEADEQVAMVMGLIEGATSYDSFGDVDFVIEAVPEDLELKQAVFEELDAVTPGHAILASNTSALSITDIGGATLRGERVCGFHFFFPASVMPLIEVIDGDDTSPETIATAIAFALALRKQPVRSADLPGFIVNRILLSGTSEIFRERESKHLAIGAIDAGLVERKVVPMGPYELNNSLGLDTVLHVAELMRETYGERFYVSRDMVDLVGQGKLGAKTGAGYFDAQGAPLLDGEAQPDLDDLAELLVVKTFAEAAYVVEDEVATHRDVDYAMLAGAGLNPAKGLLPPFMRADEEGLDVMLERIENLAARFGERFEPPVVLRRLVAQGRLGKKSGQGFYPYPATEAESIGEGIKLDLRGTTAIAWLDNGPLNSISPTFVSELHAASDAAVSAGARALVFASVNPFVFCAGADIRHFADGFDPGVIDRMNAFMRAMENSSVVTIAAVNGLAFGGGCELALACDVRLAARSALLGQPEIKLGLIPGFGGTQRLPRLIGQGRALDMTLTGDAVGADAALDAGLVTAVLDDHELFDGALAWARKAAELPPIAVAELKQVLGTGDLDAGLAAEREAFVRVRETDDAAEGVSAFLGRRRAWFKGL